MSSKSPIGLAELPDSTNKNTVSMEKGNTPLSQNLSRQCQGRKGVSVANLQNACEVWATCVGICLHERSRRTAAV